MFDHITSALHDFCTTARLSAALLDVHTACITCLGDDRCVPSCVHAMCKDLGGKPFCMDSHQNGLCVVCRVSALPYLVAFWTLPSPHSNQEGVVRCYADLLESILHLHTHHRSSLLPSSSFYDRRVQKVIACLQQDLHILPSLSVLADCSCLKETSLCRLFKLETGYSISSYMQRLRIQASLDLLLDDTLSITEIALSCGFCDPAYFSRVFKQVMGVSAQKHRKR